MTLTYRNAKIEDIPVIYGLCRQLIDAYEDVERINYEKVLHWVHRKIEAQLDEYTVIEADGQKVGYYHFSKNAENLWELDDLYLFPQFQNQGIGTAVIRKCCEQADGPVMLYVFQKNKRAVALYKRMGFAVTKVIGESRYLMKKT